MPKSNPASKHKLHSGSSSKVDNISQHSFHQGKIKSTTSIISKQLNTDNKKTFNTNQLKLEASKDDLNVDGRVSTAYRIRKTYYNFGHDDIVRRMQEKKDKINFQDYTFKQRRLLLKCRDIYNKFHGLGSKDADSKLNDRKISFRDGNNVVRESRLSTLTTSLNGSFSKSSKWAKLYHHTSHKKFDPNEKESKRKTLNELKLITPNMSVDERSKLGTEEALIHPHSTFRIVWEFLTIIPVVLTIIMIPIEFAFGSYKKNFGTSTFTIISIIMDCWFLVDMILNYHTGYVDHTRKVFVMNKQLVVKHYIKSVQIFIDFFSALPLDIIYNLINSYILTKSNSLSNYALTIHMIKYLRLFKLARLLRGKKYITRTMALIAKQFTRAQAIYRFTKIIALLLLYIHMSAMVQWLIPMIHGFPKDSWPVINKLVKEPCIRFDEPDENRLAKDCTWASTSSVIGKNSIFEKTYNDNHAAKSMLETQGPREYKEDETWLVIYCWCFLKASSQMLTLAYGGVPRTCFDVCIVFTFMLLGAIAWGLFLASIINYLQTLHVNEDLYSMKMREIVSYANFKNLPAISKQLIFKFFEMRWLGKVFKEETILQDLSPTLRRRVLMHTRLPWIKNCPIFKDCSIQYLLEVCYTMTDELYMPNQLVVSVGRICESILIPYQGDLLQYIPKLDVMEVLQPGVILGETSLVGREFWNGEVYSLGWTRAYILNPSEVRELGKLFPYDFHNILKNFKKYISITNDLTYINEIHEKLQLIQKDLRDRDQKAREKALADANDQHFTMSKQLTTKVKGFIKRNTQTTASNFTESMFSAEKMKQGASNISKISADLPRGSSVFNENENEVVIEVDQNDDGEINLLCPGRNLSKTSQRSDISLTVTKPESDIRNQSICYSGNDDFKAYSRTHRGSNFSATDMMEEEEVENGNESGGSRISKWLTGQLTSSKMNVSDSPSQMFNPQSESRRGPALLAQSQMLQTMLVKRQSNMVDELLNTDEGNIQAIEQEIIERSNMMDELNAAQQEKDTSRRMSMLSTYENGAAERRKSSVAGRQSRRSSMIPGGGNLFDRRSTVMKGKFHQKSTIIAAASRFSQNAPIAQLSSRRLTKRRTTVAQIDEDTVKNNFDDDVNTYNPDEPDQEVGYRESTDYLAYSINRKEDDVEDQQEETNLVVGTAGTPAIFKRRGSIMDRPSRMSIMSNRGRESEINLGGNSRRGSAVHLSARTSLMDCKSKTEMVDNIANLASNMQRLSLHDTCEINSKIRDIVNSRRLSVRSSRTSQVSKLGRNSKANLNPMLDKSGRNKSKCQLVNEHHDFTEHDDEHVEEVYHKFDYEADESDED